MIKAILGYQGKLVFNRNKHDGTPQKLLDVSRLTELGWCAQTSLEKGILKTYEWYLGHQRNN
jgi:GDP-L-fucose synthase